MQVKAIILMPQIGRRQRRRLALAVVCVCSSWLVLNSENCTFVQIVWKLVRHDDVDDDVGGGVDVGVDDGGDAVGGGGGGEGGVGGGVGADDGGDAVGGGGRCRREHKHGQNVSLFRFPAVQLDVLYDPRSASDVIRRNNSFWNGQFQAFLILCFNHFNEIQLRREGK